MIYAELTTQPTTKDATSTESKLKLQSKRKAKNKKQCRVAMKSIVKSLGDDYKYAAAIASNLMERPKHFRKGSIYNSNYVIEYIKRTHGENMCTSTKRANTRIEIIIKHANDESYLTNTITGVTKNPQSRQKFKIMA